MTGTHPTGWMMSEKLDGVRCVWNGERLLSRNGKEFAAPGWFLAALPEFTPLVGELWMGRGRFQSVIAAIVRKEPMESEWREMSFNVFEAPEAAGDFAERIEYAERVLPACPFTRVIPQLPCTGQHDLDEFVAGIVAAGGEGAMLRPSDGGAVVKCKPTDSDEGEVVKMGFNLELKWKGKLVKICINNDVRDNPPAIGAPVTFEYSGLTSKGLPRNPRFVAERCYE